MYNYEELDDKVEVSRFHFFAGMQGDGPSVCGTCKHFESVFDHNGAISFLGNCYAKCDISSGQNKVDARTTAVQDGRETLYEPLIPDAILNGNQEESDQNKVFMRVAGSELTIHQDTKLENLNSMRFSVGIKDGKRFAGFELFDDVRDELLGYNDVSLSIEEIDSMIDGLQKLKNAKAKYE